MSEYEPICCQFAFEDVADLGYLPLYQECKNSVLSALSAPKQKWYVFLCCKCPNSVFIEEVRQHCGKSYVIIMQFNNNNHCIYSVVFSGQETSIALLVALYYVFQSTCMSRHNIENEDFYLSQECTKSTFQIQNRNHYSLTKGNKSLFSMSGHVPYRLNMDTAVALEACSGVKQLVLSVCLSVVYPV